jgi:hypothetical protein
VTKIVLVVSVAAAVAVPAGCGDPGKSGKSSGRSTATQTQSDLNGPLPDTKITIRYSGRLIKAGSPLVIEGTVRRDGKPAGHLKLRLLKHDGKTPVGTRDEVASTITDASGSYQFVTHPRRSASWNVETSLAESSAYFSVAVQRTP